MNFMNMLMTAVMGLVLMVALFPLINGLVGEVVGGNMSNLAYSSIIILLVSMTGVFVAIGYLISLTNQYNGPPQSY